MKCMFGVIKLDELGQNMNTDKVLVLLPHFMIVKGYSSVIGQRMRTS